MAPNMLQQPATPEQPVAEGDVDGMLQALHAEYANSYFITGLANLAWVTSGDGSSC